MLRLAILGVGAFTVALVPALFLTGWTAGVLWLFVYGDDVWPEVADWLLAGTFLLAWIGVGVPLTATLYRHPRFKRLGTAQLVGVTVLMGASAIGLLVMHQWLNGSLRYEPYSYEGEEAQDDLDADGQGHQGDGIEHPISH